MTTNNILNEVNNTIKNMSNGEHCGRGFLIDLKDTITIKEPQSSEFSFVLEKDNDSFQDYGYDNETQELLDTWKNNNLGDVIEVEFEIYDHRSNHPRGYVLKNTTTGEVFSNYIFTHMELDENTWFCEKKAS